MSDDETSNTPPTSNAWQGVAPHDRYMIGLFAVVCELAGAMVSKGLVTPKELEGVMLAVSKSIRENGGQQAAEPAEELAKHARGWAALKQSGFPIGRPVISMPTYATPER